MHQRLTHNDPSILFIVLILAWFAIALFCAAAVASQARAEEDAPQALSPLSWQINADRVHYDQASDEYVAEGNVRVAREGRVLTADMIRVNQKSREAYAQGNARLLSGKDTLAAESLQWNLDSETGTLSNGTLFFSENHLYLTGKEIQKLGPETYHIKGAGITTCDGADPDWHITGSDLKVTIEGYGVAQHAALWAKQIPLIYTPYLVFPVKLKRQSGLLMPEFGVSDRKGTQFQQPLFWAINDQMDATVLADYMSERGTRWGGEFRYAAGEKAKGAMMADGLDDRRVDDGQEENTRLWGYADDAYLRPNSDRYWFRAKIDQNLPWQATSKLDVDLLSDQDYLKEFQEGHNGFDRTRAYYLETFGRDMDDYTNPIRLNQLNINRLWPNYTLNTSARWYDDVIKRRQSDTHDTLQQLPAITLDGMRKKIAGSPFYFDLLSGYTYFYREEGTRGQRADLYPRAYYPLRFFDALSVEPSAGIRQTAWHIDHYHMPAMEEKNDYYRTIYDLKLDTSTYFYRVFNFSTAGCDRLKHGIKPRIVYTYIPEQDQQEFRQFQFDALDRIDARNLITYSLTNTLIARKPQRAGQDGKIPDPFYIPFIRFKLEESFDINKHNDGDPQPFSNVLAELDLTPGRYVGLDADALWSPYDGEFYGYNAGMRLWDARGDWVGVNHRFTREGAEILETEQIDFVPGVKSINLTAVLQVTNSWRLRGNYERDIETSRLIATGVGISYLSQCWGVDLDYKEEIENRSILVMMHLMGLGSFGQ